MHYPQAALIALIALTGAEAVTTKAAVASSSPSSSAKTSSPSPSSAAKTSSSSSSSASKASSSAASSPTLSTSVKTSSSASTAAAAAAASSAKSSSSSSSPATTPASVSGGKTSTLAASGSVTVPALSAVAPIATVTATVNAAGQVTGGQAILQGAGRSSVGLCGYDAPSTFTDPHGMPYSLICGFDATDSTNLSYNETMMDFTNCINQCLIMAGCNAVAYNSDTWMCNYLDLANDPNPTLVQNPKVNLAYQALEAPLKWPATITPTPIPTAYPGASTTIISASGLISVSGVTTSMTVTDGTATVSAGATVALQLGMRWRIGG